MAHRIIRRQITADEAVEVRSFIEKIQWTPAKSARYQKCPHSYVIKWRPLGISVEDWDRFAYLIKHCSVARQWRDPGGGLHRYWYLILDGFCYWVDFPALNRADASSLVGHTASEAKPSSTSTSSNRQI